MPTDISVQIGPAISAPHQVIDLKEKGSAPDKTAYRGIFETGRSPDEPPAEATESELSRLKLLLSAQMTEKQRAQAAVREANRELRLAASENSRVRNELKRAQNALSNAMQEYEIGMNRAATRELALQDELVEARALATTEGDRASKTRRKSLALLLVVVLPAILWVAMTYYHAPSVNTGENADSHVASPASANTPHDVTGAVSRLDHLLGQFRNQKPEEVLRNVRLANAARGISVCSFEWNHGQVSLLFGPRGSADIGTEVSNCADAVAKSSR
jgi:hypothetical protein